MLGVFWTSAASAEADEAQEDFTFTVDVTALSPGVHQVEAYSVDGEGNVETSPAGDIISIQAPPQNVFLPLLMVSQ